MTVHAQTKREIELIVSRLVVSLGENLFGSPYLRAALFRHIRPEWSVGYVDVSALRDFVEQSTSAIGKIRSASDLEGLISDGIRSRRRHVSEACRVLQDVLKTRDRTEVADVYSARYEHVVCSVQGFSPESDEIGHVIPFFDRPAVPTNHPSATGEIAAGCKVISSWDVSKQRDEAYFRGWENARSSFNRLILLSAWDVHETAHHHLVALKDAVPLKAQIPCSWSDEHSPATGQMNRWIAAGICLYVDESSIALAQQKSDVEIGEDVSLARLSGLFLGTKKVRSSASLIEEESFFDTQRSNELGFVERNEAAISIRRLSKLFFGRRDLKILPSDNN